jgi:hypothetical protein
MSISKNHLENVCLFRHQDKSEMCRYLANDELDESLWICRKLHCQSKKKIDSCVDSAILRGDRTVPSGDNCPGYPILRNITQGYDAD